MGMENLLWRPVMGEAEKRRSGYYLADDAHPVAVAVLNEVDAQFVHEFLGVHLCLLVLPVDLVHPAVKQKQSKCHSLG